MINHFCAILGLDVKKRSLSRRQNLSCEECHEGPRISAAAKFGIEGWMESLTPEIAAFGIRTMLVEPGFFRTELLSSNSTTYAEPTIDDYAGRTKEIVTVWKGMDGRQGGDAAKLANVLVKLVALKEPPARFAAGSDAMQTFEAKANTLLAQARAHRELSASLAYEDA